MIPGAAVQAANEVIPVTHPQEEEGKILIPILDLASSRQSRAEILSGFFNFHFRYFKIQFFCWIRLAP
jgi:hypothetical protein